MAFESDENLSFLLITAGRLLRARFERTLERAQLEITPAEARALVLLRLLGSVRQSELAAALSVEPMTLVGYLDRLEGQGLVKRVSDPSDGRAKLIVVTDKGRPLQRQIAKTLAEERGRVFSAFGEDEMEVLKGLLQRLCKDLSTGEPGNRNI